ncbi:MAG: DUF2332 domain-containing protein, partial [Actinomycetota bacterium]|nr:DUF2332 domain-containing protein [Actinomycetota bacterium]
TAHRLVLAGRAPELAAYYPSAGGRADAAQAWPAFREVCVTQLEALREGLTRPPQTNEVGRAAALVGALLHVAAATRLPVRLVEIGASAGLNLRADRFRVEGDGVAFGDPSSPVRLAGAWLGAQPPVDAPLEVVERSGSDLTPLDPTTEDGRLTLAAYVWPDQLERLARLRGACEVAARVPARLRRASALGAVRELDLVDGTVTVVWHSVMWQYVDPAEQRGVDARLAALGAGADRTRGLARVRLEQDPRQPGEHEFLVTLQSWPAGAEVVLGSAAPHGLPTTWEQPA